MDQPASPPEPGPPPTSVAYRQSAALVVSIMGGFLMVALIKAYLFRWSHPDLFYVAAACIAGLSMAIALWFPPRLVLSPRGAMGKSIGRVWLDLPWAAVDRIEMFRTPVVGGARGTTYGGRRALGFIVKPEYKGRIRPRSGAYGYDAAIPSMWDFSIDRVGEQCLAFWHAEGGAGEIVDRLEHEVPEPLQLSSL